ncbi:MAG TPA: hypothetical protein VJ901_19855 [Thermoanaerobaculia bacterium]|nr:hypothetical protein [Thermoanaerobaculia bacterium]
MTDAVNDNDLLARRLIRAVQDDLRHWLHVARLEPELVATLYLRVRDVLRRGAPLDDAGALDELALAVYLTAGAWQPPAPESAAVIPILRRAIAGVITSKGDCS